MNDGMTSVVLLAQSTTWLEHYGYNHRLGASRLHESPFSTLKQRQDCGLSYQEGGGGEGEGDVSCMCVCVCG